MEIGLFQLENLSMIPARFVMFDMRSESQPAPPQIERLLQKSEKVSAAQVEERLKDADKAAPVVLLCEDGKTSSALMARLENAGFLNVYVVRGGISGLLSEV